MSDASSPIRTNRSAAEHLLSREALCAIARRAYGRLRQHRIPAQDRDDVAQNILLAWIESLPRLDPSRGTPEQFLHGIILNHVRRHRGRRRLAFLLDQEGEENGEDVVDNTEHTEEWLTSKQRVELAYQLFDQIPVDHLDAVLAREIDGLTFEQIADAFGRPPTTVYRYYRAGMRELAEAHERWKATQRHSGALVLPITLDSLLDAVRTTPDESAAEQVERLLRRVDKVLGHAGPRTSSAPRRPSHPVRLNGWTRALPIAGYILAGPAHGEPLLACSAPPPPDPVAQEEVAAAPEIAPSGSTLITPGSPAPIANGSAVVTAPAKPEATEPTAAAHHDQGGGAADRVALLAEVTAYDTAREAFIQGRMPAAIDALAEHARRFPQGRHALDRERMWIKALLGVGRVDEACQRAERFRRAYLKSELPPEAAARCR